MSTLGTGHQLRGGGGGLQNGRRGEACEVLPQRKGGGGGTEKHLAMLKGGPKRFWGSFYMAA